MSVPPTLDASLLEPDPVFKPQPGRISALVSGLAFPTGVVAGLFTSLGTIAARAFMAGTGFTLGCWWALQLVLAP